MKNTLAFILLFIIGASLISLVFKMVTPLAKENQPVACTMEAKMCPDGINYVGRTGPKCEFEACPKTPGSSNTPASSTTINKSTDVIMSVGQNKKIGDLSITFNRFVQDNRCPIDVQCIQAGSATVALTLQTARNIETKNLSSNETNYKFEGYNITITSVLPAPYSKKAILESEYKITFHIE